VVEKKGMGAAAISMWNQVEWELMVVPIWIALSSTVILYNSKSADGPAVQVAAEMVRISVYESRFPICKSSPTYQTLGVAD
jgi:hypothetical protein